MSVLPRAILVDSEVLCQSEELLPFFGHCLLVVLHVPHFRRVVLCWDCLPIPTSLSVRTLEMGSRPKPFLHRLLEHLVADNTFLFKWVSELLLLHHSLPLWSEKML